MIPYNLPLSEGGAAATCQFGGECPQISLAYWRPKVPSGQKFIEGLNWKVEDSKWDGNAHLFFL